MRTLEDLHASAVRELATHVSITVCEFLDGAEMKRRGANVELLARTLQEFDHGIRAGLDAVKAISRLRATEALMTDPLRRGLQIIEKLVDAIELLTKDRLEDRTETRGFETAGERATDPWIAWAVPAIQEVLAEHGAYDYAGGVECDCPDGVHLFHGWQEWREHVAPLIARRIGCDPSRAIAALQNNRTG